MYERLPEGTIRVLDLLPDPSLDAAISVRLSLALIDDPGDYEALSYTWGSPDVGLCQVSCDGVNTSVTENLFIALKRFRCTSRIRRIWIDALCIDQDNTTERTQQVKLMRQIYRKATNVLIWVGEENKTVDIELAFRVANIRNNESQGGEIDEGPKLTLSIHEKAEIYCAASDLASRPYFGRTWIVQEIILSSKSTLICGRREVDFGVFSKFISLVPNPDSFRSFYLHDLKLFEPENHKIVKQIENILGDRLRSDFVNMSQLGFHRARGERGILGSLTLCQLLKDFGSQLAKDPRDHVFGLVGLLQQFSENPDVAPWCEDMVDYKKDHRTVFLNAATNIAMSFRGRVSEDHKPSREHILTLFEVDPIRLGPNYDWPTWVPDWSSRSRRSITLDTSRRYSIDTLIPYHARVEGDSLFLPGHYVDQVSFVSFTLNDYDGMRKEVALYDMIRESTFGTPYGPPEQVFEAFWRTIIADVVNVRESHTDSSFSSQELNDINAWVSNCRTKYDKIRHIWSDRLKYRWLIPPRGPDQQTAPDLETRVQAMLSSVKEVAEKVPFEKLRQILQQDPDPEWEYPSLRRETSLLQFVITRKGYFGLASLGVRNGDRVAILAGSESPWYLRQHDQHYTVAGKGWIHGLMYRSDNYYSHSFSHDNVGDIEIR